MKLIDQEKLKLISDSIKWEKVNAVGIELIGYNFSRGILYVKFRGNKNIYLYYEVEENIYYTLMEQEHKTTFVNKEIKGNYDYEIFPKEEFFNDLNFKKG